MSINRNDRTRRPVAGRQVQRTAAQRCPTDLDTPVTLVAEIGWLYEFPVDPFDTETRWGGLRPGLAT